MTGIFAKSKSIFKLQKSSIFLPKIFLSEKTHQNWIHLKFWRKEYVSDFQERITWASKFCFNNQMAKRKLNLERKGTVEVSKRRRKINHNMWKGASQQGLEHDPSQERRSLWFLKKWCSMGNPLSSLWYNTGLLFLLETWMRGTPKLFFCSVGSRSANTHTVLQGTSQKLKNFLKKLN